MRWNSKGNPSRSGYVVVGIVAYHQQQAAEVGYSETSN